jgi:hypothetical protein
MRHYHLQYNEARDLSFPTLLFMVDSIAQQYGATGNDSPASGKGFRHVVHRPISHFVESLGL